MIFENAYFITGTACAGISTMLKLLADKHNGILCEENYHDWLLPGLDKEEFPCLTYTRDLKDWHDFIRRPRRNMRPGQTAYRKNAKFWSSGSWKSWPGRKSRSL